MTPAPTVSGPGLDSRCSHREGSRDYSWEDDVSQTVDTLGIRERLLVFGHVGSGKTYQWLKLAAHLPEHTFHVIDTDDAVPRMLATEFPDVRNVRLYPARSWEACVSVLEAIAKVVPSAKPSAKKISSGVTPKDWVVVDNSGNSWTNYVREYYIEQVFGKDMGDYWLEARKAAKPGATRLEVLNGWLDYDTINKIYGGWINPLCYDLYAHVYMTASATTVNKLDDSLVKETFASYGIRPEGEKRQPGRVHTVFIVQHDNNGWYITTVKDRGRPYLRSQRIQDLFLEYLIPYARFVP